MTVKFIVRNGGFTGYSIELCKYIRTAVLLYLYIGQTILYCFGLAYMPGLCSK